jgi:DNA-binding transcriptional regulator YiaG
MSLLNYYAKASNTSSGWAVGTLRSTLLVGVLIVSPSVSTSTNTAIQNAVLASRTAVQTTPGLPVESTSRRSASRTIAEIRRLSGLTWDQISRLFKVSRRAVHFWASGQNMTAENEEKVELTALTLRKVDKGTAAANRAALLSASSDGKIPFQLLIDDKFDEVVAILGDKDRSRASPRDALSSRGSRRGVLSPEFQSLPATEILEALQTPLRAKRETVRTVKFARVPSGSR